MSEHQPGSREALKALVEKWRKVLSYSDARFGGCNSQEEIELVKHIHKRCADELEAALSPPES